MSYSCYLCLFPYGSVKRVLTIWVTWRVSYKIQEMLTFRDHLGSPRFFIGCVRVSHLFSFLCCVVLCCVFRFCFVCLRPVSCVPNVDSVTSLSILVIDNPFCFLWHLFSLTIMWYLLQIAVLCLRKDCDQPQCSLVRSYGDMLAMTIVKRSLEILN